MYGRSDGTPPGCKLKTEVKPRSGCCGSTCCLWILVLLYALSIVGLAGLGGLLFYQQMGIVERLKGDKKILPLRT